MRPRQLLALQLQHLYCSSKQQIFLNFNIDVNELICSDKHQSTLFQQQPSQYLHNLLQYFHHILTEHSKNPQQVEEAKRLINTRIILNNIPYSKRIYKYFSQINSNLIQKWVVVVATVIQSTQKKTLDKSKLFVCTGCGVGNRINTTYQNMYQFEVPPLCTNKVQKQKSDNAFLRMAQNLYKRKKQNKQTDKQSTELKLQKCGCKKFEPLEQGKICIDYQELRVQQQFQYISSGKIPQTLTIILEGDIIGNCIFRPGDDLAITGILSYRYKKLQRDYKIQPQLVLMANSITMQKTSSNPSQSQANRIQMDNQSQMSRIYASFPMNYYSEYNLTSKQRIIIKQLQFRKEIIESFCPGIYGRSIVKLGLLLALLGGVSLDNQSTKIRGNSHVLLVGEPGTGKSVLLKETVKLAQRSFFTNGIGTTSAGLSVSYFKEGGEWMIEAGALVLADNGVCCIDELTLMTKKDEKSLLEAMQQQTISSAKASVIGKLNARTTVICACNPIRPNQKYDSEVDLQVNTGLSVPLLTRFDMIFIMKDETQISEDAEKCDHVLKKFCHDSYKELAVNSHKNSTKQVLNLKSLIKKCKDYSPQLSNHEIFTIYYTEQRKNDEKVKTARAFESLCRIAQAHAKLMLRQCTTLLDCVTAITITENMYLCSIEEYYAFLDQFNEKYGTNLC